MNLTVVNKERMENRKRIIELLTAVRYTTNDIEKVADEICSLFNVSQQRELLESFVDYVKGRSIRDVNIDDDTILYFLEDSNCG